MSQLFWNLFVELRKEVLQAQKIRAQILGFKFTFIIASISLMVANIDDLDKNVFVLPAFAAIFFDFLVNSYSFSIKRIGYYIRIHLEPELSKDPDLPGDFVMWQKYLTEPHTKQSLSMYGNLGVTVLTVLIGLTGLMLNYKPVASPVLIFVVILFLIIDIQTYFEPRKFT